MTVFACPPLVDPIRRVLAGVCNSTEAVALELARDDAPRCASGSVDRAAGLPTWVGLAGGDYILRATSFRKGRRFSCELRNWRNGDDGFGADVSAGYLIPLSTDTADYALEVYVFAGDGAATPAPQVANRSRPGVLRDPRRTPVPGRRIADAGSSVHRDPLRRRS